jgi:SulP family sulfate permease
MALPLFQSILPLDWSRVVANLTAGHFACGDEYTASNGLHKIAGTPVVTGLYTLLLPLAGPPLGERTPHLDASKVGSDYVSILANGGIVCAGVRPGARPYRASLTKPGNQLTPSSSLNPIFLPSRFLSGSTVRKSHERSGS